MTGFWQGFLEWILDERIVLGMLAIIFGLMVMWCIHWHAEKEITTGFATLASMCVGALTRGITHQSNNGGTNART